jgi:hypothetical protein
MTFIDVKNDVNSICPNDLTMLTQTLQVWCTQHHVKRSEAIPQAKVLLETYRKGKRSQIELINALVKSQH